MERRDLFKLAAASASTLWLPRSAWSQPKIAENPFSLGIASGSPTHDGVVLWTRLSTASLAHFGKTTADPVTVRWELAHDEQFAHIVQRGQAMALPELAHSVHVELTGLPANRWYFYRFMIGGVGNDWVSPTGRTRTFPAPGSAAKSLRLAYASCQRWEHGYYAAYRHMRDENLDAVLFLGDYIYEYPGAIDAVRLPNMTPRLGFVITLDDYRSRYALHKSDADLQTMHASCPWLMTWDDHEVQNDYAGLQAGNSSRVDVFSNPTEFTVRRAAAYQAYYENMPLRAASLTRSMAGLLNHHSGAELRIYQRVDFGQLAALYLLDTRQYKDPQACTKDNKLGAAQVNPKQCAIWDDPKRTLLGTQQEAWLDAQLAASVKAGSVWNVMGQSTLFGQRDNKVGSGQAFFNDGWDGYMPARTRLTSSLQKHAVRNAVILGGDVHENWVGHIKADYTQTKGNSTRPSTNNLGVEFCGTSITSRSNGNDKTAARLAENPHFIFADASRRGYGVAEFTPKQLTTTLRVVTDVTRADSGIETLARFHVQAGSSTVEPA